MAKPNVVQIPKREEAPKEAPIFSKEQAHIVAVEKLASMRKGKAWGVVIGAGSTLVALLAVLAFYSVLDAESDMAAITSAQVANRVDAVRGEMADWLKGE